MCHCDRNTTSSAAKAKTSKLAVSTPFSHWRQAVKVNVLCSQVEVATIQHDKVVNTMTHASQNRERHIPIYSANFGVGEEPPAVQFAQEALQSRGCAPPLFLMLVSNSNAAPNNTGNEFLTGNSPGGFKAKSFPRRQISTYRLVMT